MTVSELVSSLGDNPYFGAGFGLIGVGAGLAVLRRGSQIGSLLFRRHCMMSLEVSSKDKSYYWLLQWITAKTSRSTQHISVETNFNQGESGRVTTQFAFIPSPGDHFIFHERRLLKIERSRESSIVNINTGTPFETVTMTTLGRDRSFFVGILEDAQNDAVQQMEGRTVVYTALGPDWRPFGYPRRKRPIDSVILDSGIKETLQSDIQEFIQSPQWYLSRGIPYRRGYLLHGPPGCGKSSFIMALASELNYSISILSLSDRSLTDDRLQHLLNHAPLESIILLEDIDAAFVSREDTPQMKVAYDGLARVTFSGLLNALDGVASSEARILFMTTNHPGRLDPALIRPGRVDVKQKIGYCSEYQLTELFMRFYPDVDKLKAEAFAQGCLKQNEELSAAQIQGHLLQHKDKPGEALSNVYKLQSQISKMFVS